MTVSRPRFCGIFSSLAVCVAVLLFLLATLHSFAQTPAAPATPASPAASSRLLGTVKEISPNKLKVATDAGVSITVSIVEGARVLQLAAGSTDLKTAQSIAFADIEIGDRVLVTGHADAPDAFTAGRVVLMKSGDIAQKHVAEQEDWQKRGMGGLVSSIDPAGSSLTIASGARKVAVHTTTATVFRRYAPGSIKFEDAKLGSFGQIQAGDQLRVRGAKSEDGSSIEAEEIVTGSFKNLSGTIAAVDTAAGTFTLKDLASKKSYTISVTASSEVRTLPAEAAARLAARAKGSQAGSGQTSASGSSGSASGSGAGRGGSGGAGSGGLGSGSSGGGGPDLSQVFSRLPESSLSALRAGDAVILVASEVASGQDSTSNTLTAVTLLSGVEPILAAAPSGSPTMTLSPWNVGGAPDGGGI